MVFIIGPLAALTRSPGSRAIESSSRKRIGKGGGELSSDPRCGKVQQLSLHCPVRGRMVLYSNMNGHDAYPRRELEVEKLLLELLSSLDARFSASKVGYPKGNFREHNDIVSIGMHFAFDGSPASCTE